MARTLALQKNGADPVGAPDFTLPVAILAQIIESLKVDIVAQTLSTLKIEISAVQTGLVIETNVTNFPSTYPLPDSQISTLQNVTIANIAAGIVFDVNISQITAALNINNWPSTYPLPSDQITSLQQITIQNIAAGLVFNVNIAQVTAALNIANFPSEYPLPSAQVSSLQQITIQNIAAGLVFDVNIAQVTAALNIANFPSEYPLPSSQVSTLQQITIQNVAAGLYIPINIAQVSTALNISNFPSTYPLPDAQVSTLQQITIQNVAAGLYIPINIAQATATVNSNATISGVVSGVYVPITIHSVDAGVVFDINITNVQSGVVFNVNITGTPTINVQTSGGANIVIDKLTQGAYTERQSTLANNGTTPTMVNMNLTNKRGKFFPRGCRGFINSIEIYCENSDTAAHTFTIKLAPMPGMGPIATHTLSVAGGSSAAWRSVTVNRFWNYDSLFIWVYSDSDGYGTLGYDTGTPNDYYVSADEVSWSFFTRRFWFKVNFTGETVGDLPVSGTVNTIAVPNLTSGKESGLVTVPAYGNYYMEVNGAGSLLIAYFRYWSSASTTALQPSILCDGVEALPMAATIVGWRNSLVNLAHSDIYIGQWDTTNNYYALAVALPLKFRRSLKVGFKNVTSSAYDAFLHITYELIG